MKHLLKCLLLATALGLSGMSTNAAPVTDLASGATGRIEFQSMNPPDRWQYARLNMQNTSQQVVWGDLLMPKKVSGKVPALEPIQNDSTLLRFLCRHFNSPQATERKCWHDDHRLLRPQLLPMRLASLNALNAALL